MTPTAKQIARAFVRLVASLGCWLLLATGAPAQSPPAERTFHASKADVQKALHEIQSYPGGKLPVLEGFADAGGRSLDRYQRGYYQYDVQIRSTSPAETLVRVDAKITAWYAGPSAANSGYRVLKSSGRLESDLLDALDDRLNPKSAGKTPAPRHSARSAASRQPICYSSGHVFLQYSTLDHRAVYGKTGVWQNHRPSLEQAGTGTQAGSGEPGADPS